MRGTVSFKLTKRSNATRHTKAKPISIARSFELRVNVMRGQEKYLGGSINITGRQESYSRVFNEQGKVAVPAPLSCDMIRKSRLTVVQHIY